MPNHDRPYTQLNLKLARFDLEPEQRLGIVQVIGDYIMANWIRYEMVGSMIESARREELRGVADHMMALYPEVTHDAMEEYVIERMKEIINIRRHKPD